MDRFDPNIPGIIEGDVTSVVVVDPTNPGFPDVGNLVLDPTQPFSVNVEWEIFQPFSIQFINSALLAGQQWDVSVYAESYGDSPEIRIGTATVAPNAFVVGAQPFGKKYTTTITVPATTLQGHDAGTNRSGIYKLVVCVFLNSNDGAPGFDMVGFHEGPIVKAENPL